MGRPIPPARLVRRSGGWSISGNSSRWIHLGLQEGRSRLGLRTAFLLFNFTVLLSAAPVLRLVGTTVGPIPVRAIAAAGTQTVEAYNIGDGSLSLTLSSSVPWISTSVGSPRSCITTTNSQTCIPLQLTLNTDSLTNGTFTGIVTVSDPNAVDAPQTITVTVRIGAIDLYVAPGTAREATFATTSLVQTRATTETGGSWLT